MSVRLYRSFSKLTISAKLTVIRLFFSIKMFINESVLIRNWKTGGKFRSSSFTGRHKTERHQILKAKYCNKPAVCRQLTRAEVPRQLLANLQCQKQEGGDGSLAFPLIKQLM